MPSIEWNKNNWPIEFSAHDSDESTYGYQWGDPNSREILKNVRDRFILPYIHPHQTALEIGSGGGRWSQFLTGFKKLYLVDLNDCFFSSLKQKYPADNVVCIQTNGTDLPSIEDFSIDFVFSFGTFVHIDPVDIEMYLESLKTKLSVNGTAVIHYSDKTKPLGLSERVFSYNSPDLMKALVKHHGFSIIDEDLTTLAHSALIHIAR